MAMIRCPECGNSVSSYAVQCPVCGFPVGERCRPLDEQLGDVLKEASKDFEAIKKFKDILFDPNNPEEKEKVVHSLKLAVQRDIDIVAKGTARGQAFEIYKRKKEFLTGVHNIEDFIIQEYSDSKIDITEITALIPAMVFNALIAMHKNLFNQLEVHEPFLHLNNRKDYYNFCDSLTALLDIGEVYAKKETDLPKKTKMYRILLDWIEKSIYYSARYPVNKGKRTEYSLIIGVKNVLKEEALEKKANYEKQLARLDPDFEPAPEKNAKKKKKTSENKKKILKLFVIGFLLLVVIARIVGAVVSVIQEKEAKELEELTRSRLSQTEIINDNRDAITKANFENMVDLSPRDYNNSSLFEIYYNEQQSTSYWEYLGTTYESFSLPEYEFYSFDVFKMDSEYYLIPFNDYTAAPTIYKFVENDELVLVWSYTV